MDGNNGGKAVAAAGFFGLMIFNARMAICGNRVAASRLVQSALQLPPELPVAPPIGGSEIAPPPKGIASTPDRTYPSLS